MNFFELILSSAVIVAAIGFIKQNKMNRLQYVTQERGKWRNEIKAIATELVDKDQNEIYKPLTKLKLHLNGYGSNVGNSSDVFLDIFKDEHIWKVIYKLERSCSEADFKKLKSDLILYLSLLLKFDWERSKEEVRTKNMIWVSVIFLILSIVIVVFSLYEFIDLKGMVWLCTLQYEDAKKAIEQSPELYERLIICIRFVTIMCILYLFTWLPSVFDVIFKIKKWYKVRFYLLVSWLTAVPMLTIIYLFIVSFGNEYVYISWILLLAALIVPFIYAVKQKEFYINYENLVLKSMKEDSLTVYHNGLFCGFENLYSHFIDLGVNFSSKDLRKLEKAELVEDIINCLWNEDLDDSQNVRRILKHWYYYIFWLKYKKLQDKKTLLIDFIKTKPKSIKLVVIYKQQPNNEIEDLWPEKYANKRWRKKILWIKK